MWNYPQHVQTLRNSHPHSCQLLWLSGSWVPCSSSREPENNNLFILTFLLCSYGSCLLDTWGLSGFPVLLILIHNPPLHRSHSALMHGANVGLNDPLLIQYTIEVFWVQYDSMNPRFERILKGSHSKGGVTVYWSNRESPIIVLSALSRVAGWITLI